MSVNKEGVSISVQKLFLDRVKENSIKLTKSQKLVTDYIINNIEKSSYMTASKIGENIEVSESTVIRVASNLGYKSFSEMQSSIQEEFIFNQTSRRLQMASNKINKHNAFSQSVNTDISNIQSTIDKMNMNDFEEVIRLIGGARNIYTLGFRSSIADAYYLGFALNRMLGNVTPITSTGMDLDNCLMTADEQSLVIAFSFSRYTKHTIECIEYVKTKKHAKVVSITDSIKSPIVPMSDYFFLTSADSLSAHYSHVSSFTIINAILATVGQYYNERVIQNLNNDERNLMEKNTFYL
ncbi:MurR/RpiR family transcriptional regulator [Oceanobacillus timonensis]|uniref:MurR/RpiR family transcriptional regulator n=1 Tax=Oceanobacillus timonensis TaxID=1926285 RepID=UPI0015C45F48|nr:MurR/RpiR family transcriptional regulator [Oceanobacillus timonensis]